MRRPLPSVDPRDPVGLAAALIRCPSVTPEDRGSLDLLHTVLEGLGFAVTRLPFSSAGPVVDNLYARWGRGAPHFCFAGHTDVVPVGDRAAWTADPFGAAIANGHVYGRGATDMKGAIAAFVAAAAGFIAAQGTGFPGSVSLLITGDEEGPALDGTVKVIDWLARKDECPDHCVVGEPTSRSRLGDMIKIGRRGSLTGRLTVRGTQGHVAYPHLADNPIPNLIAMLARLNEEVLDDGTEAFEPSNLEITTVDVGNTAANVIPAEARATFNVRFNDMHTGRTLESRLRLALDSVAARVAASYTLDVAVSGEAFLTEPGQFVDIAVAAITRVTGIGPELSTSGGTSDARFIKDICPVIEFGLPGLTMHKVDERVAVSDLTRLAEIYRAMLDGYFAL